MSSTAETSEGHECPTCGRTFSTRQGLGLHHSSAHGEKLRAEVECAWCGDVVRLPQWRVDKADRFFCKSEGEEKHSGCRKKWMSQNRSGEDNPLYKSRIEVECAWCGSELERTRFQANRCERHFCTDKNCEGAWKSENLTGSDNPVSRSNYVAPSGEDHPDYVPRVEVECAWCGNVLKRQQWELETTERFFCGDSNCHGEWISENRSGKNHPHAKSGYIHPSGDDHHQFIPRVDVECAWCGNGLRREQWYVEKYSRFFCTDAGCMGSWTSENNVGPSHPLWQGGVFPYGEGWNETKRENVRERDGRKCLVCGMTQEQHIDRFGGKHPVHHIRPARSFDDPADRNDERNLATLCRKHHAAAEQMAPLLPQGINAPAD